MRALRRIVACCLLLTLPAQLLAACAPCCPADRAGAAGAAHHAMAHAEHAQHTALAHAGHPCDGTAAETAPHDGCDVARCAMHCAHALTLTDTAAVQSPLATGGPHFPAPAVRHDGMAPSPHLRPPIPVHC